MSTTSTQTGCKAKKMPWKDSMLTGLGHFIQGYMSGNGDKSRDFALYSTVEGDNDQNPCHRRLESLRDLLLAACGGEEHTLHLMLALHNGLKIETLAKELQMNSGQCSRWVQDWILRMRAAITAGHCAYMSIAQQEPGFALCPSTLKSLVGVDKWAVSLHGMSARYTAAPTMLETIQFVAQRYDAFYGRADNFLGGWRDPSSGTYWLDVTRLVRVKANALILARRECQLAITNLRSLVTVFVDKDADERKRRAA